jgi:hypothetical protein
LHPHSLLWLYRPMRLTLLLLALCSCAPATPRTYAQGAPIAPRPPAFNPTTDAPHTVGQPGYLAPHVEPEPGPKHGRVLPQTPDTRREPGIWAGGKPPATGAGVVVLETIILLPEPDEQEPMAMARSCANDINAVPSADPLLRRSISAIPREERECLAASVFLACVAKAGALMLALGENHDSPLMRGHDKIARAAAENMGAACNSRTMTDRVMRLSTRWLSSYKSQPR